MPISKRAEELFTEVYALAPETRARFLTDSCGTDQKLHDEISSLLLAVNDSQVYFDGLAGRVSLVALTDDGVAWHEDKTIGQWRLRRLIGRGGMGSVYLAERADGQFEKLAALKILPMGMNDDQARARFLTERQILARLVHDNIARLLDGGITPDGTPFFVMDYVEGTAIDEYCIQHELTTRQRLQLILDVSEGVRFAHRNLVIHRDLKPGNVLVEADGRARLLDFGIAKVLEPTANNAELTQVRQRPVTPVFASPEMLSGAAVDVTTDVYSLGVILYLLLTGRLPLTYDGLTLAEMHVHAATAVPPPVSHFNADSGSDIDAIVSRALAKLPAERYQSVESLANDIRNQMQGRPVAAKATSAWYRTRKFVGRNSTLVIASAVAIVSLLAATVMSTYFSIDAARARDNAQRDADIARAVNSFLNQDILAQSNPYQNSDREFTLSDAVDRAANVLHERFENQPEVKAAIYLTLGDSYAGLIQTPKAVSAYQRAAELLESANIENEAYYKALLELAGQQVISGSNNEAASNLEKLHNSRSEVLPQEHEYRLQAMNTLGVLYDNMGNRDAAIAMFEQAVDSHRRVFGEDHRETLTAMNNLALTYSDIGDNARARPLLEEVARIREQTLGLEDPDTILSTLSLGYILADLGDYEQAEMLLSSSMETGRRVLGEDHPMFLWGFRLLADVYRDQDKWTDAERLYRDALDGHRASLGSSHTLTVSIQYQLATLLADLDRHDAAVPLFEEIANSRIESSGVDSVLTLVTIAELIKSLGKSGHCEQAVAWSEKALPAAKSALDSGDEVLIALENPGLSCHGGPIS